MFKLDRCTARASNASLFLTLDAVANPDGFITFEERHIRHVDWLTFLDDLPLRTRVAILLVTLDDIDAFNGYLLGAGVGH